MGRKGEEVAARFLRQKGYDIRARNVRLGHDEIDIVAFDSPESVLVFCEVKTRGRHHPDYSPVLACTAHKRLKMFRAARAYVAHIAWEGGYRVDWLLVEENAVIDHVQDIVADEMV